MFACISRKRHCWTSPNLLRMLPVGMARSSSVRVAVRYALPVLWMLSCFYTTGTIGKNQARRYVSDKFTWWRYQLDVRSLQCLVEFIRMWHWRQSLLYTIDLSVTCHCAVQSKSFSTLCSRPTTSSFYVVYDWMGNWFFHIGWAAAARYVAVSWCAARRIGETPRDQFLARKKWSSGI